MAVAKRRECNVEFHYGKSYFKFSTISTFPQIQIFESNLKSNLKSFMKMNTQIDFQLNSIGSRQSDI